MNHSRRAVIGAAGAVAIAGIATTPAQADTFTGDFPESFRAWVNSINPGSRVEVLTTTREYVGVITTVKADYLLLFLEDGTDRFLRFHSIESVRRL